MASSISMDGEGTASEGRVDKKSGNAASSNTLFNNTNTTESVQVPMVYDTMTFESRQAVGLRDMEKRIEADMKRKRKSWEKEVERMRQEFLHLYPTDRVWGSEELLNDPLVAKRRGSTDILDPKKMKTLFLDYPDVGRKFRIRFDVSGFDPTSIHVASDGDRIIVRAIKHESATNLTNMSNDVNDQQNNNSENNANNSDKSYSNAVPSSTSSSIIQLQNQSNDTAPRSSTDTTNMNNTSVPPKGSINRAYERKIQKPKEVDPHKFKSYLTSDHILIVEAPLRGRSSYHDLRRASPASSTHHSAVGLSSSPAGSRSPSNSPGQDTPSKENKIGVPTFREENGQRRLVLIVDLGGIFKPQDITVQRGAYSTVPESFSLIENSSVIGPSCRSCKFEWKNEYFEYLWISIDASSIVIVDDFRYLGSYTASNEKDVDNKIALAWVAFTKLKTILRSSKPKSSS
ncbi:hypothetical protein HELRODRAFT_163906 [Helobdella robusta]|uniref:Uncharacterized protein n=1 Tax=Helobdella robusta TaxID=6412 RepID=T1EUL7_HELRO|nr:hypothetical protein HELRODRAFT_163906 [Helobdella robusta]ESN96784.1 hypothetical protein HELRODRAFT_163906 [Helobdella robusta]